MLYDPYAIYRNRTRGLLGLDEDNPIPRRYPPPPSPTKRPPGPYDPQGNPSGPRDPQGNPIPPKPDKPRGDKTEGKVAYEDIEPPVPKPSAEVLERARNGDETDEERQLIRDFREYQARKGKWTEEQLGQGIVPKGMSKSVLNMMNTYGQYAPNVDILNGYIWDTRSGIESDRYPDKVTPKGGGWVKMDQQTWNDMRKFQSRYFDSEKGRQAGEAWGGNNYVAEQQRKWLEGWGTRYKHVTWDPAAGVYYSFHGENAKRPFTFLDKFGREIDRPMGWTDPREQSGMLPNRYDLNEPGSQQQYPYPNANLLAAPPLLGAGVGAGVSSPIPTAVPSVTRTPVPGVSSSADLWPNFSGGIGASPAGSNQFGNAWGGGVQSPQQLGRSFNVDTSRPMPGLDPYNTDAARRARIYTPQRRVRFLG